MNSVYAFYVHMKRTIPWWLSGALWFAADLRLSTGLQLFKFFLQLFLVGFFLHFFLPEKLNCQFKGSSYQFFSLQLVLLFMCSVFLCINSLFVLLMQLCSFSVCSFKYFKAWITLSWHYRSAICVNTLLIWFFFKCILQ